MEVIRTKVIGTKVIRTKVIRMVIRKEVIRMEEARMKVIRKEVIGKKAIRKEVRKMTKKEVITKEMARKEMIRKVMIRKVMARKEMIRKEMTRKEVIRKEMARKEVIRTPAVRTEAVIRAAAMEEAKEGGAMAEVLEERSSCRLLSDIITLLSPSVSGAKKKCQTCMNARLDDPREKLTCTVAVSPLGVLMFSVVSKCVSQVREVMFVMDVCYVMRTPLMKRFWFYELVFHRGSEKGPSRNVSWIDGTDSKIDWAFGVTLWTVFLA